MIHSEENGLRQEYFEWMYHLVCGDKKYNKLSYRKLLEYLDSVDFIPIMDMDDNRRIDGIDFRYQFGYVNGYSDKLIHDLVDTRNCSVLEMMVALAFRVEEQITSNYLYGDRTSQWFWIMITSLGLGQMYDSQFDLNYCNTVIDNFMRRQYEPNGQGGLFTIENPRQDLRDVDIWTQFMWYLSDMKGDN